MNDSISILAEHVASTLPDSLVKRKRVLLAMRAVLKSSHKAYSPISRQIEAIESLQKLQSELPLSFEDGGGQ